MAQYKTPGVYVEETSNLAPSVAGVATAIPAFIGYTATTPTIEPVRISTMLEYETLFGPAPVCTVEVANKKVALKNKGFVMHDSLRLFFDNGGGVCYIVSLGEYPSAAVAAKGYKDAIDQLEAVDEVTLVSCPDLVLVAEDSVVMEVQQYMLKHCADMKDRFALLDIKDNDEKKFRDNIGINGLNYGAAYYPLLKSTYQAEIGFKDVIAYMKANGVTGLAEAEKLATGKYEKQVEGADGKKEKKEVDYTAEELAFKIKNMKAQLPEYDAYLAKLQDEACVITPSAAVAGAIVATDANVGVWQAPANISLASVLNVTKNINNNEQEGLNVDVNAGKSINAIRKFSGKGILIWGARTLDGNDNEWRYISVRRLFSYIEESVQKSTFWAVFQPNDENTWVKIKCQISNFLMGLWRDGALAGTTPEASYYVNVGRGITMSDDDINNGNLIVEIGVAAIRPAEFIVLRFSHKVQQ